MNRAQVDPEQLYTGGLAWWRAHPAEDMRAYMLPTEQRRAQPQAYNGALYRGVLQALADRRPRSVPEIPVVAAPEQLHQAVKKLCALGYVVPVGHGLYRRI